jgi:hypothetical protein
MNTLVWGPMLWGFLHVMSFNYPVNPSDEDKKRYKAFLLSLERVLPCKYCRENFKTNLKKAGYSNSIFSSRETFSRFIYDLHNEVNTMLGKDVFSTYEDVRETYELFRAGCKPGRTSANKEKGCTESKKGYTYASNINITPIKKKNKRSSKK